MVMKRLVFYLLNSTCYRALLEAGKKTTHNNYRHKCYMKHYVHTGLEFEKELTNE